MSQRLHQLEKDLQSAVARRAYLDVQRIATDLGIQAAQEWRAFPPHDARAARRIFDRLQNMLEWTRLMVCTMRASLEDELRRAHLTHRYFHPGDNAGTHVRIDM